MPPLPQTYKFQPPSTAITPISLLCASAHSRVQPETANLILCGARKPLYLFSNSTASPTLSSTPKRHHVLPTQDLTVRNDLP